MRAREFISEELKPKKKDQWPKFPQRYNDLNWYKKLSPEQLRAFTGKPRDKQTNENFADGKIKGRSRPGRVKRAGASCKGSVTDLRTRARKYGGERGRMYHWCANMKSGRQRSKK